MKNYAARTLIICTIALWISLVVCQTVSSGIQPGFPCEAIPNFCDRVYCVPPKKCSNGVIVKGGGNCACCEACITYQDIGDSCNNVGVEPATLPDGVVAQYYEYPKLCHPGLICDSSNHKCRATTSTDIYDANYKDCAYHLNEYTENEWEAAPQCTFYGDYDYKRCKGSTNTRCFCVDETGKTIFGRLPIGTENSTCACSRVVSETSKGFPMLSSLIKCTQTGDFTPLQCWGEICFCVDPYTRFMNSMALPISAIKVLPCWDSKLYDTDFYGDCQREYITTSVLVKEFAIKGMEIYPLDLPACDPDGTYGSIQFDTNKYYCSDRGGAQIYSFYTNDFSLYQTMICNCARDEYYPDGLADNYRGRNCDALGNYQNKYCVQDTCYCLDSDGQQCSNTFPSTNENVNCSNPNTYNNLP